MGGTQKYLCRKVQEGEIEDDDLLESQAKLTLLREAPKLVLDAVARGWIKYPDKIEGLDDDEESDEQCHELFRFLTWRLPFRMGTNACA